MPVVTAATSTKKVMDAHNVRMIMNGPIAPDSITATGHNAPTTTTGPTALVSTPTKIMMSGPNVRTVNGLIAHVLTKTRTMADNAPIARVSTPIRRMANSQDGHTAHVSIRIRKATNHSNVPIARVSILTRRTTSSSNVLTVRASMPTKRETTSNARIGHVSMPTTVEETTTVMETTTEDVHNNGNVLLITIPMPNTARRSRLNTRSNTSTPTNQSA